MTGALAGAGDSRRWIWAGLALVLGGGLGLRLWGIEYGLPYIYNIDEAGHFVPKAMAMFSNGLDPRYFVNPPGLTYLLHGVFAVWLGGRNAALRAYARDPASVFLVARVTVALLGALAVWLLYLVGARLFDRRVALLAAALEAVAFLPVFYAHFALNDAPTLAPLTLSLLGSALVLTRGQLRGYAFAGAGLGLGCAGKYTAGIVALALLAAAAVHYLDSPRGTGGRVAAGLVLAGACAVAAFLVANPYAALDFNRFHSELAHQSSLSDEAQGKLGAPRESGILYYLWSLTWGLGWAPALAALGGALLIWRRLPRVGLMLVPAPLVFLAFMGLEGRYFGRWLLPIFPLVCLLAAFFAHATASFLARNVTAFFARLARHAPAARTAAREPDDRGLGGPRPSALGIALGLAVSVALLAQGLIYSVHSDVVLSREDTRNSTRAWMVASVPRGARIVLEPVVLEAWLSEGPGGQRRWRKYPALGSVIAPDGSLAPRSRHDVKLEDYETTLSPALIGWYERQGYCWVITGSTESGRALADPKGAPWALAYYRALAARARLVHRASPFAPHSAPVGFSFDWSFDYYPLSYERPGPLMSVYRLHGGRCTAGTTS